MPIRDYKEFLRLVRNRPEYKEFSESTKDFTLRSLLGKDIRKALDKLNQYEQQLIKDIENGSFTSLSISKRETKESGKNIVFYKTVLREK